MGRNVHERPEKSGWFAVATETVLEWYDAMGISEEFRSAGLWLR